MDVVIRSSEPEDAAAISALLGRLGTFEGTLQLPDMPVTSRLEFLQRADPQGCRLVAIAGAELIGMANLHIQQPSLRRNHVRGLGIAVSSLGFVEEGRHKAYALKGGCYVDSISMARLHPNPPQLRKSAG